MYTAPMTRCHPGRSSDFAEAPASPTTWIKPGGSFSVARRFQLHPLRRDAEAGVHYRPTSGQARPEGILMGFSAATETLIESTIGETFGSGAGGGFPPSTETDPRPGPAGPETGGW